MTYRLRAFLCSLIALLCLVAAQPSPAAPARDAASSTQAGVDWIFSRLPRWRIGGNSQNLDCFSCHVPGAALLGASTAAKEGYNVVPGDPGGLQEFVRAIRDRQVKPSVTGPDSANVGALTQHFLSAPSPPTAQYSDPAFTPPDVTGRAALGLVGYLRLLDDPSTAARPPQSDGSAEAAAQGIVDWALAHQSPSGYWPAIAESAPNKVDIPEAASLVLLLHYWQGRDPAQAGAITAAVQRAAAWLAKATSPDARAAALKLMALDAAGDSPDAARAAADLIGMENLNAGLDYGGWRDIPAGSGGAWATGMAVYALKQFDPQQSRPDVQTAVQRGIAFLLNPFQQATDGHWESRTGTLTVNSGFNGAPVDDQGNEEIALEPTAWAVAALSLTYQPPCDPHILPENESIFDGPGQTVPFQALRAACFGDVQWSVAPQGAGAPSNIGAIDPNTGIFTAPGSVQSPIDLIVRLAITGQSSASVTTTLRVKPHLRIGLSPSSTAVDLGGSVAFTPAVSGGASEDDRGVTWSVQETGSEAGSVSPQGVYTAPLHALNTPKLIHVIARSVADPTVSAAAVVTIRPPGVHIDSPVLAADGSVPAPQYAGETVPFHATVSGPADAGLQWTVQSGPGSIDPATGLYTVPAGLSSPGVAVVRVYSTADSSAFAEARVRVYPRIQITISPSAPPTDPLKLVRDSDHGFTAIVVNAPSADPRVTWQLSDGTSTQDLPSAGARTVTLHTPGVTEDTRYSLIARSVDDPRVQTSVPLLILARSGFIRPAADGPGYPGDVVNVTIFADALEGSYKGGSISLTFDSTYLSAMQDQIQPGDLLNATGVQVDSQSQGQKTTLTVTFTSSGFTGAPGPLLTVPLQIGDDAPPGTIALTTDAQLLSATDGRPITPGNGDGTLTVQKLNVQVMVDDLTGRPGETVFANVDVSRFPHLPQKGSVGVVLEAPVDPMQPPLAAIPSAVIKGTALRDLPASGDTSNVTYLPDPSNPGQTSFQFFYSSPGEIVTPGVLLSLPLKIDFQARKGMEYQLVPSLAFADSQKNPPQPVPGTLRVIDPHLSFVGPPAAVRVGKTVGLQVNPEDVPDDEIGWEVISGGGSIEGSGTTVTYQAPPSANPGTTVTIRAFSRRYFGKDNSCNDEFVCVETTLALLPPLGLTAGSAGSTVPVGGSVTLTAVPTEPGHTVQWAILSGPPGAPGFVENAASSTPGFTGGIYHAPNVLSGSQRDVVVRASLADDPAVTADVHLSILPVSVSVPASVTVKEGDTQTIRPTVSGGTTGAVTWQPLDGAPGGIWTTDGSALSITAPSPLSAPAIYHFRATSLEDSTQGAVVEVRLQPRGRLSITPNQARLLTGTSLHLSTTLTGDPGSVTWASPSLGTLTADPSDPFGARYTAPEDLPDGTSATTVVLRASSSDDPGVSSTATVTVVKVSVQVSPAAATVELGRSLPLAATVSGALDPTVTWTLDGPGQVSTDGVYRAPDTLKGTPSQARITATSREDPRRSAVAVVTIPAVRVSIAAVTGPIPVGGAIQLAAQVSGTADSSVDWSVQGGQPAGAIDASGRFTAPAQVPPGGSAVVIATSHADPTKTASVSVPIGDVQVTPDPSDVTVALGGTLQLSARVAGVSDQTVRWALADGPGSITPDGRYAAPGSGATPATAHVTVQSAAAPRNATVTIHIPAVDVTVTPASAPLHPGESLRLSAHVANAADTRVRWEVTGSNAGTITADGVYTAPAGAGPGSVTVRAVSLADSSKAGTATITIIAPPSVSVFIDPQTATLNLGETQAFHASVTGASDTGVVWSLDGPGTLDPNGVYHAPATGTTPFAAFVTATAVADGKASAAAIVSVRQVTVEVSPAEIHLKPGEAARFAARVANAADGSVTWSLGSGADSASVAGDGTLTVAPSAQPGEIVQVVATSVVDPGAAATARVVVDPSPSAIAQTPWPMARHDVYRTGRSDAAGPGPAAPRLLWTQPDAESESSSPAIDPAGRIYVGTRQLSMISLDPGGTVLWSLAQTLQDNGWMRSSPAVNRDGTLYLVSPSNVLYAVRPDGTEAWHVSLGLPGSPGNGGTPSSPLLTPDGTIYVGLGKEVISVAPDGTLRWRTVLSPGGSEVVSSPALMLDGRIAVGAGDGALYALDPQTGSRQLLYQTFGGIAATPAVDPATGAVVFGSQDGTIYTVDPGGKLLGRVITPGAVYASAAIGPDGTACVPGGDGALVALKGSRTLWRYTPDSPIDYPVAVDTYGRMYAVTSPGETADGTATGDGGGAGEVVALTASGRLLWKLPLPGPATAAPIIGGDHTLFVSVKDHGLMAFGDSGASPQPGDLNGDGAVTLADATLALAFAVNSQTPTAEQLQAGDVAPRPGAGGRAYGDGKLSVGDVIRLLRRALGLDPDPWP